MNAPEPIPAERLALLRALDLGALLPHSAAWRLPTQLEAGRWIARLAPVFTELLDEIATLDAELDDAETELALLRGAGPTIDVPLIAAPTDLDRAAALHALLAAHPELLARPFRWSLSKRLGVVAALSPDDTATPADAELLATALGTAATITSPFHFEDAWLQPHEVTGTVCGVRVRFTAYVPVPAPENADPAEEPTGGAE